MKIFHFFIPLLFLVSCKSDCVYKEYKKFDNLEWSIKEPAVFTFNNESDTAIRNIIMEFRYAEGFPLPKMIVLVTQTDPDGGKKVIPLAFDIKKSDGTYIGDASGDIWDLEVPVLTNANLKKGTYTFSINYALPLAKLPMVMEVGLKVK